MSLYTLLLLLRWLLVIQTGLGTLLCAIGVITAWEGLRVSRIYNGGKRIASEIRLRVEMLLFVVFLSMFSLSIWFMTPIDVLMTLPMMQPVVAARVIFNLSIFLLLLMKIVQHRGRHRLEEYYDEMAAIAVAQASDPHQPDRRAR